MTEPDRTKMIRYHRIFLFVSQSGGRGFDPRPDHRYPTRPILTSPHERGSLRCMGQRHTFFREARGVLAALVMSDHVWSIEGMTGRLADVAQWRETRWITYISRRTAWPSSPCSFGTSGNDKADAHGECSVLWPSLLDWRSYCPGPFNTSGRADVVRLGDQQ